MGINAGTGKGILAYSLEFQGGTATTVEFNEDMSIADIDEKVVPVVSAVTGDNDIQTQKVAGTNQVIIKTKELSLDQRQELDNSLTETFELGDTAITAESISGAISQEVKHDAVVSVIIATICMLIYIWAVSDTHLDVYKRQMERCSTNRH